jgi:hypothetical protein
MRFWGFWNLLLTPGLQFVTEKESQQAIKRALLYTSVRDDNFLIEFRPSLPLHISL